MWSQPQPCVSTEQKNMGHRTVYVDHRYIMDWWEINAWIKWGICQEENVYKIRLSTEGPALASRDYAGRTGWADLDNRPLLGGVSHPSCETSLTQGTCQPIMERSEHCLHAVDRQT